MEKIKTLSKKLKSFGRKALTVYVQYYALFDIAIYTLIALNIDSKAKWLLIALATIEGFRYYKTIYKQYKTKKTFFGTIKQKAVFAIYGGVGTGKSTLAKVILNKYFSKENQYHNTIQPGTRIFNHRHLFLIDRIGENTGTLLDEVGLMYDSFKYEKGFDSERKRIMILQKLFGQFYGRDAMMILVDQNEDNINTVLRRCIYYVVQCKSLTQSSTSLILWTAYEIYRLARQSIERNNYINKELGKLKNRNLSIEEKAIAKKAIRDYAKEIKYYNIFGMTCIEFKDFEKVGEYGEHYAIIKNEMQSLLYFPSVQCFAEHNTRVFKEYCPAINENVQYWGNIKERDEQNMERNFDLSELKKIKKENQNLKLQEAAETAEVEKNKKVSFKA